MGQELPVPKAMDAGTLPKLQNVELATVVAWCVIHREQFPIMCNWLNQLLTRELNRRDSDGYLEPTMFKYPKLSTSELSEALVASYVLNNTYPNDLTRSVLHQFICDSANALTETA